MKIALLFAAIFLFGLFFFGYAHETIYKQIFADYGIKSRIDLIGNFPDFVTIGDKPCPNETCSSLHTENEIVAYHLAPIYFLLGLGFFFIITMMEAFIMYIKKWGEI